MGYKAIKTWCTVILFTLSCGCAGLKPAVKVEVNDLVAMNYTCRIPGKGVVSTTLPQVAADPGVKKSRIFMNKGIYKPVRIRAGLNAARQNPGNLKRLDPEIQRQLAQTLEGRVYGESYQVTIESSIPEGMQDNNRYISIKRKRTVPRVQQFDLEGFNRGRKKPPVVGEILSDQWGEYARIVAVDAEKVTVELVETSAIVENDWGTAQSVITGDKYITTISSEIGTLVETGNVIGRVIDINDDRIKLDYGHPFAEEKLACEVEILPKDPPN